MNVDIYLATPLISNIINIQTPLTCSIKPIKKTFSCVSQNYFFLTYISPIFLNFDFPLRESLLTAWILTCDKLNGNRFHTHLWSRRVIIPNARSSFHFLLALSAIIVNDHRVISSQCCKSKIRYCKEVRRYFRLFKLAINPTRPCVFYLLRPDIQFYPAYR